MSTATRTSLGYYQPRGYPSAINFQEAHDYLLTIGHDWKGMRIGAVTTKEGACAQLLPAPLRSSRLHLSFFG